MLLVNGAIDSLTNGVYGTVDGYGQYIGRVSGRKALDHIWERYLGIINWAS